MKTINQTILMKMVCLIMPVLFFLSCGSDDEEPSTNCAALASQLEAKYDELNEIGYDCTKMQNIFDEMFDILNKGKECQELKDMAEEEGYNSVDEYIEYLESYSSVILSDC